MKKFTKHTPEQIVARLEKADELAKSGKTMAEICREIQVCEPTLRRWRKQYGTMGRLEARELKKLREENAQLKRMLGQAELEKAALKDLAEGKF
ncbi:transposase [Arcanobacterium phocae]|uniref:transposase n=1 Tax=Arcanobacterium phocae TaxID=131112 RepID=UPI001C0F04ED|nr:transposase [Arcanobacterium phocae]